MRDVEIYCGAAEHERHATHLIVLGLPFTVSPGFLASALITWQIKQLFPCPRSTFPCVFLPLALLRQCNPCHAMLRRGVC